MVPAVKAKGSQCKWQRIQGVLAHLLLDLPLLLDTAETSSFYGAGQRLRLPTTSYEMNPQTKTTRRSAKYLQFCHLRRGEPFIKLEIWIKSVKSNSQSELIWELEIPFIQYADPTRLHPVEELRHNMLWSSSSQWSLSRKHWSQVNIREGQLINLR